MDTPNTIELLDYIAGRGSDAQRQRVELALGAPNVRRRYEELARVWHLLGQADAPAPAGDIWPDIAARLRYASAPAASPWTQRAGWWLRAAAAVVLAAGAGILGGRVWLGSPPEQEPPEAVAEADVIESLGLSALSSGPVVSLAMEFEDVTDEQGEPTQ